MFFAEAIIRPITRAARVARKLAPRRIASFEPPSSRLWGKNRFRAMPAAAPIRMEAREARNATVELMGVDHLVGASGIKAGRVPNASLSGLRV